MKALGILLLVAWQMQLDRESACEIVPELCVSVRQSQL